MALVKWTALHKWIWRMDRTILSIIALVFATAGALTFLGQFASPQLNQAFWGENPYALKRDAISAAMSQVFLSITLSAVVVQAIALVFPMGDREYRWPVYLATVSVCTVVAWVLVAWIAPSVGHALARPKWFDAVRESQRQIFSLTSVLIRNDGLSDEQLALDLTEVDKARLRESGRVLIAERLAQLEDLFEIAIHTGSPRERLDRLRPIFEGAQRP